MSNSKSSGYGASRSFGRTSFARHSMGGLSLAIAFLISGSSAAQESEPSWSSFRNGGDSHVADDAAFPLTWSQQEGIAWQVELPGYGQSAPLVVGDKILLTAVEGPEKKTNLVVCLNRKTGAEL